MKTQLTKLVLFAISAGFFLISCAEQESISNELAMGTVDFSIQENTTKTSSKKGSKLAAKTNTLEQVSKAIITIIGTDGSPTDFTNAALDVYRLNGSLFVQKLALPVGDYQLSAFSFTDESNTIIYVTPQLGSDLADLVVAPLSIDFSVGNGTAAAVDVEVVSTETYTPADFGLVSFPVVEVQTLDFLLAVSELGANEILAGEYAIATTGFSTTKSFTAIEENVLTVRDIENAVYSLTINVAGYEEFTTEITRDDIINIYHQRPLVIELTKIIAINGFVDAFAALNWTTSGVISRTISDSSIVFNCGSGGGGMLASITIPSDGVISFDWDIAIRSAGQYGDNISYIINGVSTALSTSGSNSGSVIEIPVSQGDLFEFSTWGTTQSSSYYGSIQNFTFTY